MGEFLQHDFPRLFVNDEDTLLGVRARGSLKDRTAIVVVMRHRNRHLAARSNFQSRCLGRVHTRRLEIVPERREI